MTAKSGQSGRLIELLARGESQANAARQTGLSDRTIRRRLDDPAFRQQVDEFRAQMLESASGRLADLLDQALDTLADLMTHSGPPAVRLQAAKCVFESALKYREAASLEQRLLALELAHEESF
jgi:hypothetical protein